MLTDRAAVTMYNSVSLLGTEVWLYRAPLCDLGPIRLNIYARKKSFVPNGQMSNNRNHQHPKQQHLDLLLGGYILKAKGGSRIIFTTRSHFEEMRPGTLFRPSCTTQ